MTTSSQKSLPPDTIDGAPVVVWRPHPARRLVHQAALTGRAVVAARRRRDHGDSDEAEQRAGQRLLAQLKELPREQVQECRLICVPGDRPPWLDSGIDVQAGERVSTFSWGRVWLSRALDVWFDPRFQLWARVGTRGPVFRATRTTNTFTCAKSGRLYLGSHYPGTWADQDGRMANPPRDYRRASGAISTIVVRWAAGADPESILARLATGADPHDPAAAELTRLQTAKSAPDGWRYAWILGDAEIWSDVNAPENAIDCHCVGDVGVVQREVDVPLTPTTRLRWRWRVDRLPSELAEDCALTHDYMSIAVEFENGQDLTYHWSAKLPEGYAYRCPLPYWKHLETHVALRSGTQRLGQWLTEDRPVQEDYRGAVGKPPARIVRVWLIAVCAFQRGVGASQFADIELVGDDATVQL